MAEKVAGIVGMVNERDEPSLDTRESFLVLVTGLDGYVELVAERLVVESHPEVADKQIGAF